MKYTYGEYRYNKEFQRGMKKMRDGLINEFTIQSESFLHIFTKVNGFIERKSIELGEDRKLYSYYNRKGRRVCPLHLKPLEKIYDGIPESKCSKCDYYVDETPWIHKLETKPSEVIHNLNKVIKVLKHGEA